jgi:uncharacterized protein YegJ (DUF2314 family)
MSSANASKKTATGFAEILSVARAAGLTAATPQTAADRLCKSELFYFAFNDPLMSEAVQNARAALPGFLALARKPAPTMERFAVKITLAGDNNAEYFWIYPFAHIGERFIGQVNNTTYTLGGLRKGVTMAFHKRDIVDWMYVDSGVMKGNYSARAILRSALPRDRAEFKRRFGLEFDF